MNCSRCSHSQRLLLLSLQIRVCSGRYVVGLDRERERRERVDRERDERVDGERDERERRERERERESRERDERVDGERREREAKAMAFFRSVGPFLHRKFLGAADIVLRPESLVQLGFVGAIWTAVFVQRKMIKGRKNS